ncbi:MAG: ATP phosphoribosyltransferase [Dehalococcoidia bacterium]|nr:ATP phosphoribosyltransferase [Dehalococcoidia bacterium]
MVQATYSDSIRIALPKGRFHGPTADMLEACGFGMQDYNPHSRQYRVTSSRLSSVAAKVLQEKDISVHVSVGNYDLGICGRDWVREMQARYPASALLEVACLDYREGAVYVATSVHSSFISLAAVTSANRTIRIASEYPSVATKLAAQLRLRRFQVFPVWGAADAYPPESADVIVLWARNDQDVLSQGLIPVAKLFDVDAVVVANAVSLSQKDMSYIFGLLHARFRGATADSTLIHEAGKEQAPSELLTRWQGRLVKLALPDGHQKTPTVELLERAQLAVPGYAGRTMERRLLAEPEWLSVKVIRPQDMPLQVASGHFDIAITGQDWLTEHKIAFPASPVRELVDLGFGKVRVVAALSQSIPVETTEELRDYMGQGGIRSLRVASEYTNIADKYLRDNHIRSYRVMPTWGASEAFLPDDADLLVDNTQTGKTLADNGLKIIEVILRSSACLIANSTSLEDPAKREKIDLLTQQLAGAVQ